MQFTVTQSHSPHYFHPLDNRPIDINFTQLHWDRQEVRNRVLHDPKKELKIRRGGKRKKNTFASKSLQFKNRGITV